MVRVTRVVVVANPVGRTAGRAVAALGRRAAALGVPLDVVHTTREEPGETQVREAVAAGATSVVAVGGDGTVREAASALRGTGVPLGIVPTGTANLFALNLGLLARRVDPVDVALSGTPRAVDVGVLSWRAREHPQLGEWTDGIFLVLAGIGFDAAAVLAARPDLKRRLGWLEYVRAGVRYLPARRHQVRISADGGPTRTVSTWSVLVGNCGRLPGGIQVFPDSLLDDGRLETLEVPIDRATQWLSVAAKGMGLRPTASALRYGSVESIRITPDHPLPMQRDGDVVDGVADLIARVDPGALLIRRPEETP